MKDAKGHGSNGGRGKVKVSVTRPVGYTVHSVGPGGVKTLEAAGELHSGTSKSDAAPVHDAMHAAAYGASDALARGDFPLADAIRRANGLPGGNADQPGWKPAKGTEARYAKAVKMRDATTHNLLKR